ncbi:RES family NAD+ phosphorylase [Pedobacter sp. CFBP9032]|uniref:RES family NAD+ phosphorylase n=1 Tax=Pedobacter sp. CFBP9032 TaxID=3096539 RepID=UPI002A6AC80E|nr:RES family NAD+ phosphorylase [Pedobacter sp. CFBP9032]MDY0903325.1 RES family NAD+ phosphorylase [Pedobacter sp. CFBP9032]
MNGISFPSYLQDPDQVQKALNLLDNECLNKEIKQLFFAFEKCLGIKAGDTYPITRAFTKGQLVRARLNDSSFKHASHIEQIGVNLNRISQGRANPDSIPIFYAANRRMTAAYEILQHQPPGVYEITIGVWDSKDDLCLVNLVNKSDEDFKDLSLVHSKPDEYVKDWPDAPRKSSLLLLDYFANKMKAKQAPGLFNITNVLSIICYSLQHVDGIGYGAVSDKFQGYNVAIKNYQKLNCKVVERWKIQKLSKDDYINEFMSEGKVNDCGNIIW